MAARYFQMHFLEWKWINFNQYFTDVCLFVFKGQIKNIPALVEILAWYQSGDKPLSELIMFSFLVHICITQPQWVNSFQSFHKQSVVSKCKHMLSLHGINQWWRSICWVHQKTFWLNFILKCKHFHSAKYIWNFCLQNVDHKSKIADSSSCFLPILMLT